MWTSSLSLRVALIAAGGSALALLVAGGGLHLPVHQRGRAQFRRAAGDAAADADHRDQRSRARWTRRRWKASSGGSFSRPLSGWYWQTRDAETGRAIDWSPSLHFDILPVEDLPTAADPSAHPSRSRRAAGRELRALEQLVTSRQRPHLCGARRRRHRADDRRHPRLPQLGDLVARRAGGAPRARHRAADALGLPAAAARARGPEQDPRRRDPAPRRRLSERDRAAGARTSMR